MSVSTANLRELHRRTSDGATFVLLWEEGSGCVFLNVEDGKSDVYEQIEVDPERALDALAHPFVYLGESVARRAHEST